MTLKISIHPPSDVLDSALDRHAAEMRAIPGDRVLRRVNVDIAAAVSIALGAHPSLLAYRAELREKLPATPPRYVDELDTIAYALLRAHMGALAARTPDDRLAKLVENATELRKTLQADAAPAVRRGLLDADAFAQVPKGQGRLDTARAVLALAVLFRSGWSSVRGRTGVTEEELDRAARVGVELLAALGREDNPTAAGSAPEAEELRLRAWTLFSTAYDECRRAMHYLRWHEDDAGDIAPALTGPRGGRARKAERDDGEEKGGGEGERGGGEPEGKGGGEEKKPSGGDPPPR